MPFFGGSRRRDPSVRRAMLAALLALSGGLLALAAISTLNGRGALEPLSVAVELSDPKPLASSGELGVAATVRNNTDARVDGPMILRVFGPTGELGFTETDGAGVEAGASVVLTVVVTMEAFDSGDDLQVDVELPAQDGSRETRSVVVEIG